MDTKQYRAAFVADARERVVAIQAIIAGQVQESTVAGGNEILSFFSALRGRADEARLDAILILCVPMAALFKAFADKSEAPSPDAIEAAEREVEKIVAALDRIEMGAEEDTE